MRTIAIASQKGGVGKTTTTANLAAGLAKQGRRVLVLDCDPQECLGAALGVPSALDGHGLADVLFGTSRLDDVLVDVQGMTLVPAGVELAEAELRLFAEAMGRETRLRKALAPLASRFDFAILDLPPSLGVLTINGLAAATEAVLVAQTEFLALRRLAAILRTVGLVREHLNPQLHIAGILPTMYDGRTMHAREVLTQIREALGKDHRVFEPIPRSVKFADSTVAGRPIFDTTTDHAGAQAYTALTLALDLIAAPSIKEPVTQ